MTGLTSANELTSYLKGRNASDQALFEVEGDQVGRGVSSD